MSLEGKTFGRLTVLEAMDDLNNSRTKWKCLCSCGRFSYPNANGLKRGISKSCGCMRRESMAKAGRARRKHGGFGTPTYGSWSAMKSRCYNKKATGYENYGGRGIRVCVRWLNSFEAFLEDMGERPSLDHTLDRLDVDGDYEPSNCKWSTMEEQNQNKRSVTIYEIDGLRLTMPQVAKRYDIPLQTLYSRLIRDKLSIQEAVSKKAPRYLITYKGETKTIGEWARTFGIDDSKLRYRLNKGLPFEYAILRTS